MYRATRSFTCKDYDVKQREILADDFTTQDEIDEYLLLGYIVVYDDTIEITENGQYNVEDYETADVNVSGGQANLQSKDVTITTNGTTTIEPDTGYDGLSDVDVTVSGILDTSDANATADNIEIDKTAYVNGQKLTGNVYVATNGVSGSAGDVYIDNNFLHVRRQASNKMIVPVNANIDNYSNLSTVASVVGATANKIKKDEVICGVTGTYEGGGSVPDWSQIGYSTAPQPVLDDFAYSKNIYDSWDSSVTSLSEKFYNDSILKYMPLVDTSNVWNMGSMLGNCTSLTTIPLLDTSSLTAMNYMCSGCTSLITIPLLDTSKVTHMAGLFQNCTSLATIPLLDTGKVKFFQNCFAGCTSLTNESLNNILLMCANTSSDYTGTKTLKYIGLTSEQATTCQSLSNWSAFVAAGWTTGY